MSADARLGFLVAGVQKAGTSALFDYLREVPDLQLPDAKELHFFDDETRVDWAAPDYAPLHRAFAEDGRLRGEATPITLYWPPALDRVRAYNPAMKLVLIFRDPVERAFSHWRMEFARGKESEPFAWCIREGRARMARAAPFPGFDRVWSYVERGFYGRQLARALRLFPREQLLILGASRLDADPDGVVAEVCRFLSVPAPAAPLVRRRVREAPAIAYPSVLTADDRAWLSGLYASEISRFRQLAGFGNEAGLQPF